MQEADGAQLPQNLHNLCIYRHLIRGLCCAVIYDMNGREAEDAEPVLSAVGDIGQYIFCSSAGVYLKSDQLPHHEEDATDPKSRHKVQTWFMVQRQYKHCRCCTCRRWQPQ